MNVRECKAPGAAPNHVGDAGLNGGCLKCREPGAGIGEVKLTSGNLTVH